MSNAKIETNNWLSEIVGEEIVDHNNHELSVPTTSSHEKQELSTDRVPLSELQPVPPRELLDQALRRADQFHRIILPATEEMGFAVQAGADANQAKALADLAKAGTGLLKTYADIFEKYLEVEGALEAEKIKVDSIKDLKIGDTYIQNNTSITTPTELMKQISDAMHSNTMDVDKLKELKETREKLKLEGKLEGKNEVIIDGEHIE